MTTRDCPRCGVRVDDRNFGGWTGCFVSGRPVRSPVCDRCAPGYFDDTPVAEWCIILGVVAFLFLAALDVMGLL